MLYDAHECVFFFGVEFHTVLECASCSTVAINLTYRFAFLPCIYLYTSIKLLLKCLLIKFSLVSSKLVMLMYSMQCILCICFFLSAFLLNTIIFFSFNYSTRLRLLNMIICKYSKNSWDNPVATYYSFFSLFISIFAVTNWYYFFLVLFVFLMCVIIRFFSYLLFDADAVIEKYLFTLACNFYTESNVSKHFVFVFGMLSISSYTLSNFLHLK